MRFFYVNAQNQAVGPVDQAALEELRRQGQVNDGTRVSREGDTAWRTYADCFAPVETAGGAARPQARPVSVTVFGICNIFFGTLGVICIPVSAIVTVTGAVGGAVTGESPLFHGWQIFSTILSFFIRAALLTSGIGLIRYREWGRKLALVCAGAEILLALASIGMLATSPLMEHFEGPQALLMRVGMVVPLLVGLAYPVIMSLFLARPGIRAALQEQETE